MTINKNKNSLLAQIKPLIRRFTSVDFGNVVYEEDFLKIIDDAQLEVVKYTRVPAGWNLLLHVCPVYYV